MTASMKLKGLLAGIATVGLIGTAMAQGAAVDKSKSAPVGAGQQSTQGTPMGTTGTPGGAPGGAPAMNPSTAAAPATMPSSSMTTSSGGSAAGSTMTNDTAMAAPNRTQRRARADRN